MREKCCTSEYLWYNDRDLYLIVTDCWNEAVILQICDCN